MADYGPTPPPLPPGEGPAEAEEETPMTKKPKAKPARIADVTTLDTAPYVLHWSKDIPLTQLLLDEDMTKGQIRVLDPEQVEDLYQSLDTTANSDKEVKSVVVWQADVLGVWPRGACVRPLATVAERAHARCPQWGVMCRTVSLPASCVRCLPAW